MKHHILTAFAALILTSAAFGKTIPNHAIADLVLGQPDFINSAVDLTKGLQSLNAPGAIAIEPETGKVFVADTGNNRVLRYPDASSLNNGAAAEATLGLPKTNFFTLIQAGMKAPEDIFIDHLGRLWVADTLNNRVLMFSKASALSNQPLADQVFGQASLIGTASGTSSQSMSSPSCIWVDASDRLWVSDTGNHRILRFDSISNNPAQNSAADGVIGQENLVSNTLGSLKASFESTKKIAVSATGTLFVADTIKNRVLRFDNAATLNGIVPANAVLGQANFDTSSPALSATGMNTPAGLTLTPDDSLWVCDEENHRVLRFDQASTKPNGAAADGVVGQADFITKNSTVSDRGLTHPSFSPFEDAAGSLWVPDRFSNRVLRFPADLTAPVLTVTSKLPKSTKKKKITIKGESSDVFGISEVRFGLNQGALKPATGTTQWQLKTKLKKGKNKITIFATDSVGNVGSKVIKIKRK
jgi:sugar lactone lactonase YvrE